MCTIKGKLLPTMTVCHVVEKNIPDDVFNLILTTWESEKQFGHGLDIIKPLGSSYCGVKNN